MQILGDVEHSVGLLVQFHLLLVLLEEPLVVERGREEVPEDHGRGSERQKQREKKAKEMGVKLQVRKKYKVVEEHYDDCGDDISSLGVELEAFVLDQHMFSLDDTDTSSEPDTNTEDDTQSVPLFSVGLQGNRISDC